MTTTSAPDLTVRPERDERPELRVTTRRVVTSEWIKFWSLRSTAYTLLGAVVALVAFALIAASVTSGGGTMEGLEGTTDPTGISLAGTEMAQLVIGTLGVLLAAGEYSTGLIRSTLAAVPRRLPVLWAKTAVLAGVVLTVGAVAVFGAFFAGQAILGSDGASLTDPGVLRAVSGAVVYLTGIGLLGMALGALLRNTAGAVTTLFASNWLLPGLMKVALPHSWNDTIGPYFPSNAGSAFMTVSPGSDLLSPGAGLAVFVGFLAVLLGIAALQLKRRDA
ncbi:ABC transporter permease OS=Streptomyces alboniger OX=132473 GN=CP975_24640 PE=4 SV=1 [Streptomyces alboniger]|uniref:ABC transporter permease n=1 Tax=Streptomyces ureilyticus TaxID=1775131 RepID=A0ABX0DUL2_9ACTN|nr:ABC transporter permease [Streptomyces ureilyticus]NGO45127.1 ABC transporter permease [Streptomyces ureilyticus]